MAMGKGRKKIETKLIEKPSARMTCFSKRRCGLFKKAEDLCVLSGAKIGVLAFSQGGKIYCSDAETLDYLIFPQADVSAEKVTEVCWNSIFAEATKEVDWESIFPEATAEFDISTENDIEEDAVESDLAEAMIEELYTSDVSTLNPLLFSQLNISSEVEVESCWEFNFVEAMAGKDRAFWFSRTDVQAMGSEELQRLERAILEYGEMQAAKNSSR